ncbi:MAG: phytoene/squalene synthase family protein [bacterium]|nr:phytoene/squalene synthase family protein [bacterium]
MINKKLDSIFRQGSSTYYYSSIFFPHDIKEDVFILYAFVRQVDNLVDSIPQKTVELQQWRGDFDEAMANKPVANESVSLFADLCRRRGFDKKWVDAFFRAMEADTKKTKYATFAQLEAYMYGSAEVIGLMLANIIGLPIESHPTARLMGKSMQYINFIRDIEEDNKLGRQYIPQAFLARHQLNSLEHSNTKTHQANFTKLIEMEIKRYFEIKTEAAKGLKYLPKRCRIPVATASQMYDWTAKQILIDPFIVYSKAVKPSKSKVLLTILYNTFLHL